VAPLAGRPAARADAPPPVARHRTKSSRRSPPVPRQTSSAPPGPRTSRTTRTP